MESRRGGLLFSEDDRKIGGLFLAALGREALLFLGLLTKTAGFGFSVKTIFLGLPEAVEFSSTEALEFFEFRRRHDGDGVRRAASGAGVEETRRGSAAQGRAASGTGVQGQRLHRSATRGLERRAAQASKVTAAVRVGGARVRCGSGGGEAAGR